MTGHGTALAKLPPILRDSLPPPRCREGRQSVHLKDLPLEAQRWIWQAFDDCSDPRPRPASWGPLLSLAPPGSPSAGRTSATWSSAGRCSPERRLAVEFRQRSCLEERNAQETSGLPGPERPLRPVSVWTSPEGFRWSIPPLTAVTNPALSAVRFHGRNQERSEARGISAASVSATSTGSRNWPSGCPASGRSRRGQRDPRPVQQLLLGLRRPQRGRPR